MKTNALILLGLLSQTTGWADVVWLDDAFADGSRTGGSLPHSAQWYSGGASANTYVTNHTLVVSGLTGNGLGTQGVLGAFAGPGTELSLTVGEQLTLSFDYNYAANANQDYSFGFGFYNSGGRRLATDGTGFNSSLFNAWTGYSAFGIFGQDPSGLGRFHLAQRVTTANNLMTPFNTGTLATTHQTDGLLPNTWYTAVLRLYFATTDSMVLSASIGGETLSVTTQPAISSFDTVMISDGAQAIGSLGIGNVLVLATSPSLVPVPEPSVWALASAGFGLLSWVHWRRNRGL